MNSKILEKRAIDFRKNHGLGPNDSINLEQLLFRLNILTVFKPLSNSFSGMAIKVGDEGNKKLFILINSSHPIGKQHFTIGHELYHLFIQESFTPLICNTGVFNQKDKEEYNADVFASYLLLPEGGIIELIPDTELGKNKITLKTILKIEQNYTCSRAALLYRLKQLGIIDSVGYEFFKNNVIRGAIQFGYDTTLYKSGNNDLVIGDYGILANELFEKEKISESHYFSLLSDLGINIEELLENGEE